MQFKGEHRRLLALASVALAAPSPLRSIRRHGNRLGHVEQTPVARSAFRAATTCTPRTRTESTTTGVSQVATFPHLLERPSGISVPPGATSSAFITRT